MSLKIEEMERLATALTANRMAQYNPRGLSPAEEVRHWKGAYAEVLAEFIEQNRQEFAEPHDLGPQCVKCGGYHHMRSGCTVAEES